MMEWMSAHNVKETGYYWLVEHGDGYHASIVEVDRAYFGAVADNGRLIVRQFDDDSDPWLSDFYDDPVSFYGPLAVPD